MSADLINKCISIAGISSTPVDKHIPRATQDTILKIMEAVNTIV